jgi:hypothetical protein
MKNRLFSLFSVPRIKAGGSYFGHKGHVSHHRSNQLWNAEHWDCGFQSNSGPRSMYTLSLHVFVSRCVGRGLARGQSSVQSLLPNVCNEYS